MNRTRRSKVPNSLPGVRAEWLESRILLSATLVGNLPTSAASSNPSELTVSGNHLYFASTAGGFGNELWATDGTPQGTALLKDINPGAASSNPSQLTDVGGTLFLTATDASGQTGLWRSDGTAGGTVELAVPSAVPSNLTAVRGRLFFAVNDTAGGPELWTSDGTSQGTREVVQFSGSPTSVQALTDVNGTAFFWDSNLQTAALWKSDGTAAGTVRLGASPGWQPSALGSSGGAVYFPESGQMWESDGTPTGTRPLTDFPVQVNSSTNFLSAGGWLYFSTAAQPGKLFRTDGTAAGTTVVFDGGPHGSTPSFLATLNGSVFFEEVAGQNVQTWKTDGTATGNVLLLSGSYGPSQLTAVGSQLFFILPSPSGSPLALWVSDGTPQGTMMLKTVDVPNSVAGFEGKLYLALEDPFPSFNLWVSDGTAAGTTLFDDLAPGSAESLYEIKESGGTLYINVAGYRSFSDLWAVDSASSGAVELNSSIAPNWVSGLIPAAGRMFFMISRAPDGLVRYLGVSDGTPAGTHTVGDRFVTDAIAFNGSVLFVDGSGNIWSTDGTHTFPVTVGTPAAPAQLTAVGSLVFFVSGNDLWATDGTFVTANEVGTPSGIGNNVLFDLKALGSTLIFFVRTPSGLQVWKSDGTSAGTMLVKDLGAVSSPGQLRTVGDTLFFSLDDGAHGSELWKTDGTSGGTGLVKDINPGAAGSDPSSFGAYNGRLYFSADDGSHGRELWTSDGTEQGTTLVADINPGPGGSGPSGFTVAGGLLYFNAFSPTSGNELWSSDGTTAGTSMVQDLYPGPGSSNPQQLTDADGTLYFIASDPTHQNALWRLPVGGTIEGSVFNDANHNGIQDAGESGLAGTTVYLDLNHNNRLDRGEPTARTDSSGNYRFSDLRPGTYSVRELLAPGFGLTGPLPSATSLTLGAGDDLTLSFGNVPISSVPLDFAFLLSLAQHYGQPGTFIEGDVNGDGQVDFDDLILVAQNYGHPLPAVVAAPAGPLVVSPANDSFWGVHKARRRTSSLR